MVDQNYVVLTRLTTARHYMNLPDNIGDKISPEVRFTWKQTLILNNNPLPRPYLSLSHRLTSEDQILSSCSSSPSLRAPPLSSSLFLSPCSSLSSLSWLSFSCPSCPSPRSDPRLPGEMNCWQGCHGRSSGPNHHLWADRNKKKKKKKKKKTRKMRIRIRLVCHRGVSVTDKNFNCLHCCCFVRI